MKHVFLDTNVVIDYLTYRLPFAEDAAKLFEHGLRGNVQLYVSALSINNTHYVVSRLENPDTALRLIKKLADMVEILPVDRSIVQKAMYSDFKDFEDAVQNFCAAAAGINILVTRNIRDYTKSSLSILTATDVLNLLP